MLLADGSNLCSFWYNEAWLPAWLSFFRRGSSCWTQTSKCDDGNRWGAAFIYLFPYEAGAFVPLQLSYFVKLETRWSRFYPGFYDSVTPAQL